MNEFKGQVTVSIVSHKQWALTERLLRDLNEHCADELACAILTNNIPEKVKLDGELNFPIEVIQNTSEKGFGANHNAAFARSETPWFLVLNPDIRLGTPRILSKLLQAQTPVTALLAPRIIEPGANKPAPLRSLITPLELVRRRLPFHSPPRTPDWIAGMFMLIRKESFAEIRGFDERFFMYCEDFDLCARLRIADWRFEVVHGVVAQHDAQRASAKALRPMLWHVTSLARVWTSATFWRYWLLLLKEKYIAKRSRS